MAGVLYMVATPIGNLGDISVRANEVLGAVDFISCEDTRVTKKLVLHLGINKELVSLHHHTPESTLLKLVDRIKRGESAAYVSDAGTPGINDPGGKLIEEALKLFGDEISIIPIPGPSALTTILSISGFPAELFTYLGFPPNKKGREKFFKNIVQTEETVVFLESTYRIIKALETLKELMPNRKIVVGRELTKLYESVYRGTSEEVLEKIKKGSTKGEFVVVLSPIK